jgi:hypothetical protein
MCKADGSASASNKNILQQGKVRRQSAYILNVTSPRAPIKPARKNGYLQCSNSSHGFAMRHANEASVPTGNAASLQSMQAIARGV